MALSVLELKQSHVIVEFSVYECGNITSISGIFS